MACILADAIWFIGAVQGNAKLVEAYYFHAQRVVRILIERFDRFLILVDALRRRPNGVLLNARHFVWSGRGRGVCRAYRVRCAIDDDDLAALILQNVGEMASFIDHDNYWVFVVVAVFVHILLQGKQTLGIEG